MDKPVSPYLQRPLRTLEEAQRDLDQGSAAAGKPAPTGGKPPKSAAPKDTVTIGGQDVPIVSGNPGDDTKPGSQIDVTA